MINPSAGPVPTAASVASPSVGRVSAVAAAASHSAQPAALGYIYQAQYALMELLRDGPERPDGRITLEKFDDVAWVQDETPTDKLQTKYRRLSTRELSDYSPDLWKTMRSWIDGEAPANRDAPRLFLVTTEIAAAGTAAAALRAGDARSVSEAVRLLDEAARKSVDMATKKARDAYLAMDESDRFTFVSRIAVLDGAPTLSDLAGRVSRYIRPFSPHGRESVFADAVLGWWYKVSIALLDESLDSINYDQAHSEISRLRDRFLSDQNLPPAPGIEDPVPQRRRDELEAEYAGYRFVQRMIDIAFPPRNLQLAVLDYYRAVSATTFWLQNSLIMPHEIALFEARLKEEWVREFEFMCTDLPPGADDSEKKRRGRELLRRLLDAVEIKIRPAYVESSLARGTRHILADRDEIAWHPDFAAELERVLGVS